RVTLTASPFYAGLRFLYWTDAAGNILGTSPDLSVTMGSAQSISPVYTPPDKSLIVAPDGTTVYWLQNNHIYHVTDKASVVDVMENAVVPGWVWNSRKQVMSPGEYTVDAEFIEGDNRSNGLVIRQVGTPQVYLIENGQRRWIVTEA